ncbi:MAG: hypothetical protein ACOC1G_02620, partial [Phycisphaeraceae bacterium]
MSVGCSDRGSGPSEGEPKTQTTDAPAAVSLADIDLGAMERVPADASLFASWHDVWPRMEAAWESRAMQKLVMLPAVQMGLAQLQSRPEFRQAMMLKDHPLAVQGLPVLRDAFSQEVFVCAGGDVIDVLLAGKEVDRVVTAMQMQLAFSEGDLDEDAARAYPSALIDAMLEQRDRLRAPSMLMGFRLDDVEAAEAFLDQAVASIGPVPVVTLERREVRGHSFHVVEVTGQQLPPDAWVDVSDALAEAGVSEEKRAELEAFIRGLRLTLTVGVMDQYLLVSVAEGEGLLAEWGGGPSLAAVEAAASLRQRAGEELRAVALISEPLARLWSMRAEDIRDMSVAVAEAVADRAPAGLMDRVKSDADQLVADFGGLRYGPVLKMSFANRGFENISIRPYNEGMLAYDESLDIAAHRGSAPIVWSAGHAAADSQSYETLRRWLIKGYGYFEDYALPEMEANDREEFEKSMTVLRPLLASVDRTTRQQMLPAVRGVQSIAVLDGGGRLAMVPGVGELNPPAPLPRLGFAIRLHDVERFKQAMSGYAAALDQARQAMNERFGEDGAGEMPPLPEIRTEQHDRGTLYRYDYPWQLGADLEPAALLTDDMLILSTSRPHLQEMLATATPAQAGVVALSQPSGHATVVEFRRGWEMLARGVDTAMA